MFYPEKMQVSNTERRMDRLEQSWNDGLEQTKREWDTWMEFLG